MPAPEWEAARQQLLVEEKELTRARDALAAKRRRMPWLPVEKAYEFDGPGGRVSLLDLFEGRRQLILYRAFFEPGVYGWPEHACIGCSLMADQVADVAHLNARDVTFAYVTRAPQPDVQRLKAQMGWTMPWYTITDSFDIDFGVDQYHGTNVFVRDGEGVYRTYFLNNRGDEALGSTWSYLDLNSAGAPGGMGGLTRGLPTEPAVRLVELARRIRQRHLRPHAAGPPATPFPALAGPIELVVGDSLSAAVRHGVCPPGRVPARVTEDLAPEHHDGLGVGPDVRVPAPGVEDIGELPGQVFRVLLVDLEVDVGPDGRLLVGRAVEARAG